jgi:signal transduction histidine kinase
VVAAVVTAATLPPLCTLGRLRWWVVALGVAAAVPVAWRRRALITVCLIVGVATMALAVGPTDGPLFVPYGMLLCAYSFAAQSPPRVRTAGIAVGAAGIVVALIIPRAGPGTVRVVITEYVAAYAVGVGARAKREQDAADSERARRIADAQVAAAQRERLRIARDMHDIVTHSVGLMVVQAEAGPVVARTDPARAEAVFDTIAATGREAIDQLRMMLGALRGKASQEPASRDRALGAEGREPAPGIGAVAGLVARAGRDDLRTSVIEVGTRRPVPAEVGVAAYRIVQESLTNVVRHSGAHAVEVTLVWTDTSLDVRVADDGCGRFPLREGHGLLGMRERAQACGGTLLVDPRGFTVTASLPLAGRPSDAGEVDTGAVGAGAAGPHAAQRIT